MKWLKEIRESNQDAKTIIQKELERRYMVWVAWQSRKHDRLPSELKGISIAKYIRDNNITLT